jgi:hypothetical protein
MSKMANYALMIEENMGAEPLDKDIQNEIRHHNTLMEAAHLLVVSANGGCFNDLSMQIEKMLENYYVNPETGNFKEITNG